MSALAVRAGDTDQSIPGLVAGQKETWFSLEFAPAHTHEEYFDLPRRLLRMSALGPLFVDITMGPAGAQEQLAEEAKDMAPANFHLTANMTRSSADETLWKLQRAGVQNLVVFDPPVRLADRVAGAFASAVELVRRIRDLFGDHFSVTVCGYVAGRPDTVELVHDKSSLSASEQRRAALRTNASGDEELTVCRDEVFNAEIRKLKEKVDAGAQQVMTSWFLEPELYVEFVRQCREADIRVPIYPQILCWDRMDTFLEVTEEWKSHVPQGMMEEARAAAPQRDFEAWSVRTCIEMCRHCLEAGAPGLHLDTLNSQRVPLKVLLGLGLVTPEQAATCEHLEREAKAERLRMPSTKKLPRSPEHDIYTLVQRMKSREAAAPVELVPLVPMLA